MKEIAGEVWVLVVEDDPYARDLMTMLLVRDWRTQVTAAVASTGRMQDVLQDRGKRVDVILLDVEHAGDPDLPFRLARQARDLFADICILAIGAHPNARVLQYVLDMGLNGYLVKNEVRYSLAWAVTAAGAGQWVTTPGVRQLAANVNKALPANVAVEEANRGLQGFTLRQQEIVRLAILYNLRRKDIADELYVTQNHVNQLVSEAYGKLLLTDILTGEIDPAEFFSDPHILARFEKARQQAKKGGRRGAREKATLAFHLLTTPEIN